MVIQNDSKIFDLILEEESRQIHGIELIASENFVSDQVMKAAGSCLTNKYAEAPQIINFGFSRNATSSN